MRKEANEDDEDEEDKAMREYLADCGEKIDVDILEQGGQAKPKKAEKTNNANRFFSPTKILEENLLTVE